jgi:hypothetical protein
MGKIEAGLLSGTAVPGSGFGLFLGQMVMCTNNGRILIGTVRS